MDGIAASDGEHALIADGGALTPAVVRMLKNASLREELAKNASLLIQSRYSWSGVAAAYEALYRSIIDD
jgi:glycosyltransferase involved in cell wall biosynthesis